MCPNPFATLMEGREQGERRAAVPGLRFAEVVQHDDEGYILTWLSGSVSIQSAPARVATMMAGAERGTYFMPEVGDEVVVGFEDGDIDKPVILGALWSADTDAPPSQADTSASNNIRTIVSRSGHQLTFDDSPGAEKVLLQSKSEHQVLLDDAPGAAKIAIETAGGLKIVMDDVARSITIELDSANKIEISSAGVTVKGTQINLNP